MFVILISIRVSPTCWPRAARPPTRSTGCTTGCWPSTTAPPAPRDGRIVATLRDTTELRALTGRAEVARERLQLLYDARLRIGTTLDVIRTAEELARVAVPRFADAVTVDLLESVLRGEDPERARHLRCAARRSQRHAGGTPLSRWAS